MHIRTKKDALNMRALVFFLTMEIALYMFNSDKYMQLSGFYLPLILAIGIGFLTIIKSITNKRRLESIQKICIVLLAFFLLSAIVNIKSINRGYFLSYLVGICLLVELSRINFSAEMLEKIKNSYVFSAFVISVLILVLRKRFYALESTRLTIQIGNGDLIDPNYLAFFLICPLIICVEKVISKGIKNIYSPAMLVIFGGVFMTGSRGAFLSVAIAVIYLFFAHPRIKQIFIHPQDKRKRRKYIFGLLVILVVGIFLIPQETMQRLFEIDTWMGDSSNVRRFELWSNAIKVIIKRPIIGYGAAHTGQIIGGVLGEFEPAHNTFLDMCLQCGGIFVVVLLLICCKIFIMKRNKLSKSICIATLIAGIFISAEATLALWLNLGISIALIRGENDE